MNIPESVLRASLVVGDKRISQSSDVGMQSYSVLADAYLRELDDMPITPAELLKDGWKRTSHPQPEFRKGNNVVSLFFGLVHPMAGREPDYWELESVPEFELQTMGDLRTVLRLRGESA